jgi:hypothetical protein
MLKKQIKEKFGTIKRFCEIYNLNYGTFRVNLHKNHFFPKQIEMLKKAKINLKEK